MAEFPTDSKISARIHIKEKKKLKKSGYNARQAIEYFNSVYHDKIGALKIDEYFLNKEIEDLKEKLILKERKLSEIQKAIDDFHIEKISYMRADSYKKIIEAYNRNGTNESFESFINGKYIQELFINDEVEKFPECGLEEFCDDLLKYYNDVILLSPTF